jgi:hypothetical protein
MPSVRSKARTVESYLAGIGASGALMAGAIVMFVILIGIVTFNNWPKTGQLFGGSSGNVRVDTIPALPPPPRPNVPNLAALLGAGATGGGAAGPVPAIPVSTPAAPGAPSGGGGVVNAPGTGGTGVGGGGATSSPQAMNPPTTTRATNPVSQLLSGVGNNVQSDTNALGQSLGGSSSPGLGGVVGGLGQTVNSTLQGLANTVDSLAGNR